MNGSLDLWEGPTAEEVYMIAGWEQWADAGEVSSELPRYLVDRLAARRIGQIRPQGFYMFQVPGTHHFLRPEVKLEAGHRKELTRRTNEFYYAESAGKGLVIFRGEEPHLNAEGYADAFFDAVEALGVRRVLALGGVYGAVPYDRDRQVSCVYSLPRLKEELEPYALDLLGLRRRRVHRHVPGRRGRAPRHRVCRLVRVRAGLRLFAPPESVPGGARRKRCPGLVRAAAASEPHVRPGD